ncbi:MAG: abortive infection family protein [Bacteroidales bacterium]|nr:abortive infection family protein [Bacteroidales bacterium]
MTEHFYNMAQNITSVTKRDIFQLLTNGWDDKELFGDVNHKYYNLWGLTTPEEFLNRLYPLQQLPSFDTRLGNAAEDIYRHTVVNPNDYSNGWFWKDSRFNIGDGEDEILLNFLVEIFHPEVRDDRMDWQGLLAKINKLLNADGYKIVSINKISGRNIYGWKPTQRKIFLITDEELDYFSSLFNNGGYVLDFTSRKSFNDFTERTIGVRVTETYGMSMGKSLTTFFKEEDDEKKIIKLILELWDCYKVSSCKNIANIVDLDNGQKIIERISNNNIAVVKQVVEIKAKFDNIYIQSQIDEMLASQEEDPTNAIGLAKELIESCCKTILEHYNIPKDFDNLSKLVKATTKTLKITPEDIPDSIPEAKSMKAILGAFATITDGLANLRNTYGRGHGKDNNYKGLGVRHAKLAIGASSTLVHFLWDSFSRNNTDSKQ